MKAPAIPSQVLRRRRYLPYLFQSLAREVALTVLEVRRGERVLEVGTGSGETLLKIATLVGPDGRAVGVDVSPQALRIAEARLHEVGCANFEIHPGDPTCLPLPAASFDAVYCAHVLGALGDPDLGAALAEMRRVLVPGGRLALTGFTPGERPLTRTVTAAWDLLGLRPRPRRLEAAGRAAGFELDRRLYIEQRGAPSEVLLFRRPAGPELAR